MTFVGMAGRLGAISAETVYIDESLSLLGWLSNQWGPRVSAASPATTLYRQSQISGAEAWVDPGITPRKRHEYAESVATALSRPTNLLTVRIPGAEEYLVALDEAVAAVTTADVKSEDVPKQAAAALSKAAKAWRAINERLGVKEQRAAYRKSLGLEP